jgi:hypothetical protein
MGGSDDSRSSYRGFEVVTGLVSFDASGWTARYSVFVRDGAPHTGLAIHRSEVRVATHRVDCVLAAARGAAYRWIDESQSQSA